MIPRLGSRIAALAPHRPSWRQVLLAVPELAVGVALVLGLEHLGARSPHDGTDLLALTAVVLTVILLLRAADQGWMPITQRIRGALRVRGRAATRWLEPRFALAMRPAPDVSAPQDPTLRTAAPIVGALALLAIVAGPRLHVALTWLRMDVSYTVYLLVVGLLWATFLATTSGASLVAARSLHGALGHRLGPRRTTAVLVLMWFVGLVALGFLPGILPLIVIAVLGLSTAYELAHLPDEPYRLCRRGADGTWRTLPILTYLWRVQAAGTLVLVLVAALGQADRLWIPRWPRAPFGMTAWLGLVAAGACLVLVGRMGSWLLRVAGARGDAPERPLVPTLWSREPDQGPEPEWLATARQHGWLVLRSTDAPSMGFDLVAGFPHHPASVRAPEADEGEDDIAFRLERRFHIVQRRRFYRSFQRLFKEVRPARRPPGSGFLFGPHIRFLAGLLRDAERPRPRRAQMTGPPVYGTPYARGFPTRTRRYVGSVLRDLDVDVVFFEDGVAWPDLRRVFGVLFECYDQRRTPLDVRHFRGLPRVRVLMQADRADPDMEGPDAALRTEDPPPGLARTLVILRDRGEGDVTDDIPAPGTSRRTPSGLGVG